MSQKGFNAIAGIIILAVLVLVGGVGVRYLVTKKPEPEMPVGDTSTARGTPVDMTTSKPTVKWLSESEFKDFMTIDGRYFVQMVSFPASELIGLHDPKLQAALSKISKQYNRYIIRVGIVKGVYQIGNIIYYYRVLVGPFSREDAEVEKNKLVAADYSDAFVNQIFLRKTSADGSIKEDNQIQFIAGANNKANLLVTDYTPYNFVLHYDFGDKDTLILHGMTSFENERETGPLIIFSRSTGTISKIAANGFVVLPDKKTALVARKFELDDASRSFGADPEKVAKAAKEIGVAPLIYYRGGKPAAETTALFKIDLITGEQTSLKEFHGRGGIYALRDGSIYISDSGLVDDYKYKLYSKATYYRFDPNTSQLMRAPENFSLDYNQIEHPIIPEDLSTIDFGFAQLRFADQQRQFYWVLEFNP